jgi:hypothetical protein
LASWVHAAVAYAQQDVLITTTGERLVGEIIRVEKDVLTFSTGYSDADFKIEWDKVASLESTPPVPGGDIRREAFVRLADTGSEREGGRAGRGTACSWPMCRRCSRSNGVSGRGSTRAWTSVTA